MFDWFREIGMELSGLDSDAAKKERIAKREKEKANRFIFGKKMKICIIILAALYVVMAASSIIAFREQTEYLFFIIKYIVMAILALVILFSLLFGKRKGEVIALVGIFIFVVGLFLSVALV